MNNYELALKLAVSQVKNHQTAARVRTVSKGVQKECNTVLKHLTLKPHKSLNKNKRTTNKLKNIGKNVYLNMLYRESDINTLMNTIKEVKIATKYKDLPKNIKLLTYYANDTNNGNEENYNETIGKFMTIKHLHFYTEGRYVFGVLPKYKKKTSDVKYHTIAYFPAKNIKFEKALKQAGISVKFISPTESLNNKLKNIHLKKEDFNELSSNSGRKINNMYITRLGNTSTIVGTNSIYYDRINKQYYKYSNWY